MDVDDPEEFYDFTVRSDLERFSASIEQTLASWISSGTIRPLPSLHPPLTRPPTPASLQGSIEHLHTPAMQQDWTHYGGSLVDRDSSDCVQRCITACPSAAARHIC